jgi:hypothetical protein
LFLWVIRGCICLAVINYTNAGPTPNWANPDFTEQEKAQQESREATEKKQQRGRLEQGKSKLSEAYHDACDGVYATIIEEVPGALHAMVQIALEETPCLWDHCQGTSSEEHDHGSMFLSAAVHNLMEQHYPKRFAAINDAYHAQLGVINEQLEALG